MPKCAADRMVFEKFGRRFVEADFSGGAISSGGGLLLLREVDRQIGLSRAAADVLHDERDPARITHALRDLVAQRLYGLCCGYEDINDHDRLRHDPLVQTAVGRNSELASSPTFSQLETAATRADCIALNRVLIEQFIAGHRAPPAELISTSTHPMCPCTAIRRMPSSTATTTTTAICRFTSSAGRQCSPVSCLPRASTARSMRRQSSRSLSIACANNGRPHALSFAATPVSAASA